MPKNLTVEDYFKEGSLVSTSLVVRGDTKQHKEELMELGGKFNAMLKGGPGYIFPKSRRNEVETFITGKKAKESPEVVEKNRNVKSARVLLQDVEALFRGISLEEKVAFLQGVMSVMGSTERSTGVPTGTSAKGKHKEEEEEEEEEEDDEKVKSGKTSVKTSAKTSAKTSGKKHSSSPPSSEKEDDSEDASEESEEEDHIPKSLLTKRK